MILERFSNRFERSQKKNILKHKLTKGWPKTDDLNNDSIL